VKVFVRLRKYRKILRFGNYIDILSSVEATKLLIFVKRTILITTITPLPANASFRTMTCLPAERSALQIGCYIIVASTALRSCAASCSNKSSYALRF